MPTRRIVDRSAWRAAAGLLLALVAGVAVAGCGAGSGSSGNSGAGGRDAGASGSGGGAGAGVAGSSAGGAVASGMAGSGAAGSSSGGGGGTTAAGAAGSGAGGGGAAGASGGASGGAAGATGGAGNGVAGSAGAAGAGGGAGQGGQAGAGVFVMCDDHADFNGRGRCAATGKIGAVFAFQSLTLGATRTTLTAVFGTTTRPSEAGCAREAVGGACTAVTCPGAAVAPGPQAGAISAKSNGGALVTTPNAAGAYDVAALDRALWTLPKAALTFAAAGGATPAFGETFCGPTPVTMTKPAEAPGGNLNIDRASDLQLQWTGGAGGDLELVLVDETASREVQCFFTASAGQGTVPKAALAKIGAGVHVVASYLWMRKIGGASSGSCIELTAITTNASAAGAAAPFNGNATFQ